MKPNQIQIICANDCRSEYFELLLQICETSVRKTHHFLSEKNLHELRPLVRRGLETISLLYIVKSENVIAGFMGIENDKLEMLFLAPEFSGHGIGRKMLDFAAKECNVKYVDVNEQNPAARGFYEHCGFVVYNRSELDGQGNPFPILHLTKKILETERLYLREMTKADFPALCAILQDSEVMTAYEGAFSDSEAQDWLDRQLARYKNDKVGLWTVILKESGTMIGQCGLTIQPWKERKLLEVGYLFQKAYWHNGYATEAAIACRDYAFDVLKADAVYSIIRDMNIPSQRVAERNGMTIVDQGIKHFRGIDMPHFLYEIKKSDRK